MKTFKVTNVICRFNSSSGGPPRTVASIARAGSGVWDAELFTTNYVERQGDTLLTGHFPGHVNVLHRAAGFWNAFRTQLVEGIRPNVIHIHGVWSPYLVAFARVAYANGIPVVVAPHGMLEPWPLTQHARRKSLAMRTYQGWVLRKAAAVHATSDAEAANLRALGVTKAPIFVIPNLIDEPPSDAVAGRGPGAGSRNKTLLFLSRIHPKKGLDMLLRAWADLQPRDWNLLIVGHGEPSYVNELKKVAETLSLQNVEFRSHVDGEEREAMFARSDALILPTFSENFGNIVAEAMVRGLPVITTTGTPWSVVAEKQLGWYVEPNPAGVKQALAGLFATNSQALSAMGARAKDYVKKNLLLDAVKPKLFEMYRAALRQ